MQFLKIKSFQQNLNLMFMAIKENMRKNFKIIMKKKKNNKKNKMNKNKNKRRSKKMWKNHKNKRKIFNQKMLHKFQVQQGKKMIRQKIFQYHLVLISGKMMNKNKRMHQLFKRPQRDQHCKTMIGNKLKLKTYLYCSLHFYHKVHHQFRFKFMLANLENKKWLKKINMVQDLFLKIILRIINISINSGNKQKDEVRAVNELIVKGHDEDLDVDPIKLR